MTWNEFKMKYGERGTSEYYSRKQAMVRDAKSCLCWAVSARPVPHGEGVAIQHTVVTLTDIPDLDYDETPLDRMKRVYRDWLVVGQPHPDAPQLVVFTVTEPLNLR